jgi:hypothetical protein
VRNERGEHVWVRWDAIEHVVPHELGAEALRERREQSILLRTQGP